MFVLDRASGLVAALLLVLLNAFFVAAEFALVKVRGTRLEELRRQGHPAAERVQRVVAQINPFLNACQLGITLASLALGWIGEPAFADLIEPSLVRLGASAGASAAVAHSISLAVAFTIITFLHIVVGEVAPKTLAIARAEGVALRVAAPLRLFYCIFYPAILHSSHVPGRS